MPSRAFIVKSEFDRLLKRILTVKGTPFQKDDTIYRDMSRLVVGWLARSDPSALQKLYNEIGWKGQANVRPIVECAKEWLANNKPGRYAPRKIKTP
jgi:hypothetical protein